MSFNITPVASGYQEIHPYSAKNIDSVKINTSLIMMKECIIKHCSVEYCSMYVQSQCNAQQYICQCSATEIYLQFTKKYMCTKEQGMGNMNWFEVMLLNLFADIIFSQGCTIALLVTLQKQSIFSRLS